MSRNVQNDVCSEIAGFAETKVNKLVHSLRLPIARAHYAPLNVTDMEPRYEEILAALSDIQGQELSIIRLSEPISLSNSVNSLKRGSDASNSTFENQSPASLAADLAHYKVFIHILLVHLLSNSLLQELFSKLRFSYLEQVTKEKFLRAIVGDPPQVIEHEENLELETQLIEVKAILKSQKKEVEAMVDELEARGRDLSQRLNPSVSCNG